MTAHLTETSTYLALLDATDASGMIQSDIATKIGCSLHNFNRVYNGHRRMTLGFAIRWARAVGLKFMIDRIGG